MQVELIPRIDLRDRRTVPTTVSGHLGEHATATHSSRNVSQIAQEGTEREAAIDLNTVAMAMEALLLEHEDEIDREIHQLGGSEGQNGRQ